MWAGREGGKSGYITAQELLQREGLGSTSALHFESDQQLAQKNLPCLFCVDIKVSESSK